MRIHVAICLWILAGVMIGGCAPLVRVEDMVLAQMAKVPIVMDKTLAVAPVRGGEPSESFFRVIANADNAEYAEALLRALRNTGLFREVLAGERGDLVLRTEIISQQTTLGSKIYTLLVHYDVRDGTNGRVLWRGNFYSDVAGSDFFTNPIDRTWLVRVRARTVQDNLRQFTAALTDELPRSLK